MKLLRNKYVVIGLAVGALAMLVNSFRPMWQRGRPSTRKTPAPAQVQAPQTAPTQVASKAPAPPVRRPQAEAEQPQRSIDLTRVGWSLEGPPRRDPFQVIGPGSTNLARLYPPVAELLQLSAIWRQTDSRLAVINHRIVGKGDTVVGSAPLDSRAGGGGQSVLRYTVESIEGDSVWLEGPAGREQLEFGPVVPVSATNPIR